MQAKGWLGSCNLISSYAKCSVEGIGRGVTKKVPANKVAGPLAFTLFKLALHRKGVLLQSHFRYMLGRWSTVMGKTEGKRCVLKHCHLSNQGIY